MIRKMIPAALLLAAATASAEANYACAIRHTSDGFVALREGPSASTPMVGRMKQHELVGLLHPPAYDDIIQEGNWVFVRWYPGTKRTAMHTPDVDEKDGRAGWVHHRLINCFQ